MSVSWMGLWLGLLLRVGPEVGVRGLMLAPVARRAVARVLKMEWRRVLLEDDILVVGSGKGLSESWTDRRCDREVWYGL